MLVVGAGPSGLMTAALLVRQGVRVCVVDANAGPATQSRAFAVRARTVELFHGIGLADELLQRGVVTSGIRFHVRGKHVGGLDFDRARAATTPYQFILMAPQSEVEELPRDLARHGVTVRRGTRLTRPALLSRLSSARSPRWSTARTRTCSTPTTPNATPPVSGC
ncbi:FAD-dependent monooxygenase [Lentzea sp. NPDC060358]|uniref:FAD-dependent monooxygenase n=1 Tax=Lentzea sp. NPDC060358 TaxID=3347103 RepID=UPI0036508212